MTSMTVMLGSIFFAKFLKKLTYKSLRVFKTADTFSIF